MRQAIHSVWRLSLPIRIEHPAGLGAKWISLRPPFLIPGHTRVLPGRMIKVSTTQQSMWRTRRVSFEINQSAIPGVNHYEASASPPPIIEELERAFCIRPI